MVVGCQWGRDWEWEGRGCFLSGGDAELDAGESNAEDENQGTGYVVQWLLQEREGKLPVQRR